MKPIRKQNMPENYYPEIGTEKVESAEKPVDEIDQEEGVESRTALIPKSLIGTDVKVGDTVSMKVVHLYEDEIEVEAVGNKEETMMPQQSAESEIDMMANMKKVG